MCMSPNKWFRTFAAQSRYIKATSTQLLTMFLPYVPITTILPGKRPSTDTAAMS
jgi:hypothetical protein